MKFSTVDEVDHSADEVFHLIRDAQPSLVPFLDDVEEVVVLEREDRDAGVVFILNRWRGSKAKAPAMAQKFLKPEILTWKDHALWYPDGPPRAEWRLEPTIGGRLFECTGTTSMLAAGDDRCRIKIEGEINVYPDRLPGVPRLLASRIRGPVEQFIVNMIVPNLQSMARGVQAYFDAQKANG